MEFEYEIITTTFYKRRKDRIVNHEADLRHDEIVEINIRRVRGRWKYVAPFLADFSMFVGGVRIWKRISPFGKEKKLKRNLFGDQNWPDPQEGKFILVWKRRIVRYQRRPNGGNLIAGDAESKRRPCLSRFENSSNDRFDSQEHTARII